MSFKGEISAAKLDSIKSGFKVGDIYRIIDAGKLNGIDIPFGTFVEWRGTSWRVNNKMEYATSKNGESLDKVTTDMLDDHDAGAEEEEFTVTSEQAAAYAVGHYYATATEIFLCTAKTDNGDDTFTIEATKKNGIVPVINELVDRIATLED